MGLVRLVVEPEASAPDLARGLIERAAQDIREEGLRQTLINLIEIITVYKFTSLSWEEIEDMLGLNLLKETKVYQEALEEGCQEERRSMIEAVLVNRFGDLDTELMQVVEFLAGQSSDEFMVALLTESRESLVHEYMQ